VLSSDEVTYIRSQSGDDDNSLEPAPDTSDPIVSDTMLNYYFDNRTDGTNDERLDKTIVWTLREMKAATAHKVQRTNLEGESKSAQQFFEHIEKLLEEWEKRTGLAGGIATIGTINLGIDEEDSVVSID